MIARWLFRALILFSTIMLASYVAILGADWFNNPQHMLEAPAGFFIMFAAPIAVAVLCSQLVIKWRTEYVRSKSTTDKD